MELEVIQKTVKDVTNIVNSFSDDSMKTFLKQMSFQHRTLQQSFTRLCLKWIELVASDEYRFDGRNQHSHEQCKKIVEAMKLLNNGCDLSETLPLV